MCAANQDANHRVRRLMADHGRAVESLLRSVERDEPTREELWSEVFTTAYLRLERLDGLTRGEERRWLLRTARFLTANSARQAMTRRRALERASASRPQPAPSAEEAYFDAASRTLGLSRSLAARSWSTLATTHQQVLRLDALGFDGPAMADELQITQVAARSRLMRARRAFVAAHEHQVGRTRFDERGAPTT